MPKVVVQLTPEELAMLLDALDAYEYWELGDTLPRNNGCVFIPGDFQGDHDRYWGSDRMPTAEEAEAIERVRACRDLTDRLAAVQDAP